MAHPDTAAPVASAAIGSEGVVPWGARLVASAPVPSLAAGAAIALGLAAALVLVELVGGDLGAALRGEAPQWKLEEYRFSLIFALLAGYLPAAHAYAVAGARRTLEALRPALTGPAAELEALRLRAGRCDARSLRRAGLWGIGVAVLIPFTADLSLASYSIGELNTSAAAHRVLLPVLGWMCGRFVYTTVADSRRLAELGRERTRVDLLDLSPLSPFARHGLRNALLGMGFFAICSLLLPDWGARPGLPWVLGGGMLLALGLAVAGLVLPVRGVHDAIVAAKRAELAWCREAIRRRRRAIDAGAGASGGPPLGELASYLGLVERARVWPFDASTFTRFTLYLGIPVGSWLGGALVERLLDVLI